MSSTQLSDVVIPEVYLSYDSVNNPEKSLLVQAGVAVSTPAMQQIIDAPGQLTELPVWRDLDPTIEPNYNTDNVTDVAVPQKTYASLMQARKVWLNQGYSDADLVGEIAGSSPMQHIRNRFGTYWMRAFQRRILATLAGVQASNTASNGGDMTVNLAIQAGATATNANLFNRAAFTAAAFTMGDREDEITAIAVHSAVYLRMVNNDDIAFIRPSTGSGEVPTFLGRRVMVDDTMPVVAGTTSGFIYTSYLFGAGAIGFADGTVPIPVEIYRRPDQGNGGGVEQIWERKKWALHPLGYNWTNSTVSGYSATLSDLRAAANWTRVIERKNVPLAFLQTNG